MKDKSPLIIRVKGGLGNQLYILNFAVYLSRTTDRNVLLETRTGFWRDKYKRKYELDNFYLAVDSTNWWYSFSFYWHILLFRLKFNSRYIPEVGFKSNIADLKGTIFLDGLWQNIPNHLTLEFKGVSERINNLSQTVVELKDDRSLCIHMRLVNYDLSYDSAVYSAALLTLTKKYNRIFIFTDSKDKAQEIVKEFEIQVIYIPDIGLNMIDEFWLFTQGRNFVLSDSTWSRWGYKLCSNEQKQIVYDFS